MPVLRHIAFSLAIALLPTANALADVIHVPADYATIQEAVDVAGNDDQIIVAPGTYAGFTNASQNLDIRSSDGPEVTIIDGGGGLNLIFCSLTQSLTIQGFTLRNAGTAVRQSIFAKQGALIDDCIIRDMTGGSTAHISLVDSTSQVISNCVFIDNSGEPCIEVNSGHPLLVTDCTFTNNSSPQDGAAIRVTFGGVDIVIQNSTFDGNTAPRGGAVYSSRATMLDGCTFTNNGATTGDGGAILAEGAPVATILNCDFTGNSASLGRGGAVALAEGGQITDCTLTQNSASSGGALWLQGQSANGCTISANTSTAGGGGVLITGGGTIADSPIFENVAGGNGGGMLLDDSTATNCALTGNSATGSGGGVYAESGTVNLTGCEMSENSAGNDGGGLGIADQTTTFVIDSTLCMNVPDQLGNDGAFLPTNVIGCDITCPDDPEACIGDLDGDGVVGVADLVIIIVAWGLCP